MLTHSCSGSGRPAPGPTAAACITLAVGLAWATSSAVHATPEARQRVYTLRPAESSFGISPGWPAPRVACWGGAGLTGHLTLDGESLTLDLAFDAQSEVSRVVTAPCAPHATDAAAWPTPRSPPRLRFRAEGLRPLDSSSCAGINRIESLAGVESRCYVITGALDGAGVVRLPMAGIPARLVVEESGLLWMLGHAASTAGELGLGAIPGSPAQAADSFSVDFRLEAAP